MATPTSALPVNRHRREIEPEVLQRVGQDALSGDRLIGPQHILFVSHLKFEIEGKNLLHRGLLVATPRSKRPFAPMPCRHTHCYICGQQEQDL